MSARPKILITQKVPDHAYPPLKAIGDVETNMEEGVLWSYEELLRRGPDHDYIFSLLTDNIDARFLEACAASTPGLKMVANMAVGFNNIDVDAATRLGIAVSNTPGVCSPLPILARFKTYLGIAVSDTPSMLSETSGDLAFGLLMATARRIPEAERFLRAGKYTGWRPLLFCGAEVHHSTLGLIGAGRIGKIMSKRASGFEMRTLYFDVCRMSPEDEVQYNMTYLPMDRVLQQADFVSVHTPYMPSTHHLISDRELHLMKPTAILINTARGPVVDEKALVRALQAGKIAGAGLDVFENEPAIEPELLAMENVVLLPHIGTASLKTRAMMATMASDNIVAHFRGQRPPNILNPEVLQKKGYSSPV